MLKVFWFARDDLQTCCFSSLCRSWKFDILNINFIQYQAHEKKKITQFEGNLRLMKKKITHFNGNIRLMKKKITYFKEIAFAHYVNLIGIRYLPSMITVLAWISGNSVRNDFLNSEEYCFKYPDLLEITSRLDVFRLSVVSGSLISDINLSNVRLMKKNNTLIIIMATCANIQQNCCSRCIDTSLQNKNGKNCNWQNCYHFYHFNIQKEMEYCWINDKSLHLPYSQFKESHT